MKSSNDRFVRRFLTTGDVRSSLRPPRR